MESIRIFLDTDVLINWLAREVDPNTGKKLWEHPYRILKMIESGKISGTTSLINLMEIIFVLRRKKKWKDEEIISKVGMIQEMQNFAVLIPTEADIISAYNLQTVFKLDPFDSIYHAASRNRVDYIITRDSEFIEIVNSAENRRFAMTPEEFLELVEQEE
mgnify:CR=1 FL=1